MSSQLLFLVISMAFCVCVFFWGVGGNFCHNKLPEAEVCELRGTNLRTEEGKINVGFKVLRVMVIKTAVF